MIAGVVECACCGQPYPEDDVARLGARPDVAVCAPCVRSLADRLHARPGVVPILPVRDQAEAVTFWAGAGIAVEPYDAGYAFLTVDGAEIAHLATVPGLDPAANSAACYVHVGDPPLWRERLAGAGLPVTPVRAEPWGMTEFSLRDPSGNLVRVGHPS